MSLIATPLVLGLINLVDAYTDRDTEFKRGKLKYEQLVGEGQEAQANAPEQGHSVGKKRLYGIIAEARGRNQGVVEGSGSIADEKGKQGVATAVVIDPQAKKTIALMRPQHDITENILHITRIALLQHEGIVLSVSEEFSKTKYVGRTKRSASSLELERRIQQMGGLVERAAIARDREDLSRMGKPTFEGCR
jgi:hypothetical protein